MFLYSLMRDRNVQSLIDENRIEDARNWSSLPSFCLDRVQGDFILVVLTLAAYLMTRKIRIPHNIIFSKL